jgi:hypothetical protein
LKLVLLGNGCIYPRLVRAAPMRGGNCSRDISNLRTSLTRWHLAGLKISRATIELFLTDARTYRA